MLDIKSWLSELNLPVEETAFIKPPNLPYLVYLDVITSSGDDQCYTVLFTHDLNIELYQAKRNPTLENDVERLFRDKGFEYQKNVEWLVNEKMFMTMYSLNFIEKE